MSEHSDRLRFLQWHTHLHIKTKTFLIIATIFINGAGACLKAGLRRCFIVARHATELSKDESILLVANSVIAVIPFIKIFFFRPYVAYFIACVVVYAEAGSDISFFLDTLKLCISARSPTAELLYFNAQNGRGCEVRRRIWKQERGREG